MSKFRLPVSQGEGPDDWGMEDEDPPGRSSWRDLRFAPALGRRVAAELSPLVAPETTHLPDLDSKSLQARMDDVPAAIKGGERMVVHLLSHGFLDGGRESDLVIAATDTLDPDHDDVRDTAFAVRDFLSKADRKAGHLLLLLDACHGGGGPRLDEAHQDVVSFGPDSPNETTSKRSRRRIGSFSALPKTRTAPSCRRRL